jgi:hypothetical protein
MMKVYKHDKYNDKILLAYPAFGHILGIPFHQDETKNKWVRSGIGTAIPYYTQEKLDTMECIGDTEKDWDFIIDPFFDASYLIDKREQKD